MSDAQYAPLTAAVVRTLTDKLYERRKAAALDIEKQVRDLVANNHISQLEKLLCVLKELTIAQNGNTRKGGLIGMAAAAIALGKGIPPFVPQLIEPVLTCFSDTDSRVRYYACESLYNIVKISRSAALALFPQLFDTLWKLSSDVDQNVRSGAELLDRLLKDIVTATPDFEMELVMNLIRAQGYAEVSSSRRFVVSWLNTLLTVPEFNVLVYLPEVLDQLFLILSDEDSAVKDVTKSVLGQFLGLLGKAPEGKTDIRALINILIIHAGPRSSLLARQTALIWMERFVTLFGQKILPNLSHYLTVVLPCIHDSQLKAKDLNKLLMDLVADGSSVGLDPVVEVLLNNIHHERTETRIAVLNWIKHMHTVIPNQIVPYIEKIFSILLELLSDQSDDVLLLDLNLLSDICEEKHHSLDYASLNLDPGTTEKLSNVSPYLIKFCVSLVEMFRSKPNLMNDRAVLIVRRICLLLDPSHIYQALSLILLQEPDVEFVSRMVAMLNSILLTATELFVLRDQLKKLDTKDSISLFSCVYRCWCHQPIALLGLCLLTQNYAHACNLVEELSHIDITVELLLEIDRLVQLIESPILAYIRMDLLNATHHEPLAEVLSALLMLLPQTDAFTTLHKRLQAVPAIKLSKKKAKSRPLVEEIDFDEFINHFQSITLNRQNYIRQKHRDLLNSSTD